MSLSHNEDFGVRIDAIFCLTVANFYTIFHESAPAFTASLRTATKGRQTTPIQ